MSRLCKALPSDPTQPPPSPAPPPPAVPEAGGGLVGDGIGTIMGSALDSMMKAVWTASVELLAAVFELIDRFSTFTVDTGSGAIGAVWPTLLWVSGVIAIGLFFWQLALAALRGGRGMLHTATGPIAYGIALTVTVGVVAAVLQAGDGLTTTILSAGLDVDNFTAAWTHMPLSGTQAVDGVKAMVLGLAAVFGVLPVAFGYLIELIWRQAVILLLVATIPISAAGLLAQSTAPWFWRTMRWTLAAIAMKPVLALSVVLGVASLGGASGVIGLLAGIGVLAVSLLAPFALFRLFAFVDPNTQAGVGLRQAFTDAVSKASSGSAGFFDTSSVGTGGGGGQDGQRDVGGPGAIEAANTARYDNATSDSSGGLTAAADGDASPPPPGPAPRDPGPDHDGEDPPSSPGPRPRDDGPPPVSPRGGGSGGPARERAADAAVQAAETGVIP